MAPTTQQHLQYLFVCHIKSCTQKPHTDPREARSHYMTEGHPYKAYPLPENVHLVGACSGTSPLKVVAPAPLTPSLEMPVAPPAETLEQKLLLLQGLLEKVEELADDLVMDAEKDRRIGEDSEVPDWFNEMGLDAANNKLEVQLLLKDLARMVAAEPSAAVAEVQS